MPLIRTDGTLNSGLYISVVLKLVTVPFIRALRNPKLQQDDARPHIDCVVQTFVNTENVRLLSWPASSLDLSPIKNV